MSGWQRAPVIAILCLAGVWYAWQADGLALDPIPDELTMGQAVYHVKSSVYLAAAVLLMAMPSAKGGGQ